jgi:GNAT superfamily N-acetyltransferase
MDEKAAQVVVGGLTQADLPAAVRLIEQGNWNQTRQDWLRLVRHEPQGCFAARLQGRVVATVTTTVYGAELAWIGMMFVDPEYRRRGIAGVLMDTALAYLHARGVETVKLDATALGRPVYERLGFVREGLVERWETVARPAAGNQPPVLQHHMRRALHALDRSAFGAERAGLLDALLSDSCVPPLACVAPDGALWGYVLARQGRVAAYIGPVVAADERTALALLDAMLGQLSGRRLYLDFYPGSGLDPSALLERGFMKQRDLVRMRYGRENGAGTSKLVFAIAGPEVG